MTVRIPDLKGRDLSDDERRAVGAAARRAIEEEPGTSPGGMAAAEAR